MSDQVVLKTLCQALDIMDEIHRLREKLMILSKPELMATMSSGHDKTMKILALRLNLQVVGIEPKFKRLHAFKHTELRTHTQVTASKAAEARAALIAQG